jgi:hypothetical protein
LVQKNKFIFWGRQPPLFSKQFERKFFRAFLIKLWPFCASATEKFNEVLDCGSPLPLLRSPVRRGKSGRGLPQSKTLARQPTNPIQLVSHSFIEIALTVWLQTQNLNPVSNC